MCIFKNSHKATGYRFNGKELDQETGNYYYGARYYNPKTSIWLSVDPLANKYPDVSPYNFVLNNPIANIDPDGRDVIPIVFPNYKISALGTKWSNLGHAGVLLIDNKTGETKYYEYGRYDGAGLGEVRNIEVSNVIMGKDGKPTLKSLNKVMAQISKASGKGGAIEGAYIKSDEYDKMNEYAQGRMAENSNAEREPYDIVDNNCGTFACDVADQDPEVEKNSPLIIDPRPNSIIKEYRDEYDKVDYSATKGTTITPVEK